MSLGAVISVSVLYLAVLFYVAWRQPFTRLLHKHALLSWIYPLTLAVYCSAWTYYGSIGKARNDGLEFLPVYLGPTLAAPLWWIVLRKIIRISQVQHTATLADFISARYGKSAVVAALVTVVSIVGIVPYLALQLKAISESFEILITGNSTSNHISLQHTALYVAIIMAAFILIFGAGNPRIVEKRSGLIAAIAFESVVKLVAFVLTGFIIVFVMNDGLDNLFSRAAEVKSIKSTFTLPEPYGLSDWFWVSVLSAFCFIILPRQFHVAVVEATDENHVKKAAWSAPLYLLLINIFVFPIAVAGALTFEEEVNPDYYILSLPLQFDMPWLALLVFIGGLSAATGMIIVETLALSQMFTNHLLLPLLLRWQHIKEGISGKISYAVTWSRRLAILLVLAAAYLYYNSLASKYNLVSIGLISFVSIAQFAPAIIGGIYWKGGTKAGAITGIVLGAMVWAYTLFIPSMANNYEQGQIWLTQGLMGQTWLKPTSLFGLHHYSNITHGFFWSIFFNLLAFVAVSAVTKPSVVEKNQSELYVDIFKYSSVLEQTTHLHSKAAHQDVENLLGRFFGKERARQALRNYAKKHHLELPDAAQPAHPSLLAYAERLLAGSIGSASARMMISTLAKEEEIKFEEVVEILKHSQQIIHTNKELKKKSAELKQALDDLAKANEQLKENDRLKDEFLSTVTHELRTPITSIRAFTEILYDNPDLPDEERQHYLAVVVKETERISRLITQVLDLERYESGKYKLNYSQTSPAALLQNAVEAMQHLFKEKNVALHIRLDNGNGLISCDTDKMQQVFLNLLSNALHFVPSDSGQVRIEGLALPGKYQWTITDNGKGIPADQIELIFEKFFQAKNNSQLKPRGSGLGLAITKKIIELHQGHITVESVEGKGTTFTIIIPTYKSIFATIDQE